jgi:hypothetical protein
MERRPSTKQTRLKCRRYVSRIVDTIRVKVIVAILHHNSTHATRTTHHAPRITHTTLSNKPTNTYSSPHHNPSHTHNTPQAYKCVLSNAKWSRGPHSLSRAAVNKDHGSTVDIELDDFFSTVHYLSSICQTIIASDGLKGAGTIEAPRSAMKSQMKLAAMSQDDGDGPKVADGVAKKRLMVYDALDMTKTFR